jgi:hypothetical protein
MAEGAPEDRELTNWPCKEIQEEQDPKRFSELVWQLDALLATKDTALQNCCKLN